MESRKTLLSLRWLSSSESLARIVGGQLGGGRRLAVCALLLCLGFHFSLFTAHAQGPGLYKDGKKILDLGEMVDSSFQPAAAPRLQQTGGMKLFREIFGEKIPSKDTPQKKYIRLVLECRDIVERIASYRDSDSAFMDGIGRLLVLEKRLLQANKLLLDKFSEIEKSLKDNGYPAEKIDRQAEVVEGHTIAANRLSELLANLRSAHDSNDQASLEVLIQELKQYFIDNVFRKDPPLLNSQPLPVMMEVKKAPVVQDQLPPAIPYPIISKDGPDPADLDPTIDVQFTDEIIALAASLNNSPVEMYNFVRDNFEFEAYLGSRKGSHQTLTHRSGNDYDQASLLITLLRVSGIPARYVTGTIKMTIDQATNWLSIESNLNAGSILTTCGMEGIIYIVNDDTVAISCRRVWVEAWIPFINYRGAVNDSAGFMWVPMDPTFKQYEYKPGINLLAEIDFDAEAFVNDYISTFHSETPVELFRQMLLDSAAVYHPGADYEDLITTRSVIKETDGILPGTLPYTLMSMDSTFSEIASAKRYYIEFELSGSGISLSYSTSLPEIVEKQVTISYVGATAADQEIIDTSGGIFNVDLPYLVDLKPVLKIDGCEVARGSGSVMMGITHNSYMHFTAPTGASNQIPTVSNVIIAGNYQGIGIDTEDAFPSFWDLPETSCDEEYLGQEVHQTALTYLNNVDVAGDELSDLMHQVVTNDVSEAIVGNTITVLFSGGLPVSFEWTGMIVDADRKIIGPFSVDGVDSRCDYMRLGGADGSIQENVLFESRFEEEAISAIKILELASDSGITICEITTSIAADCPGIDQPSHVITAINNALAQGRHVIIPERGFTYYLWTGTGWISIDPATCAAGYIISGGHNGGATVQDWSQELQDMLTKETLCIRPEGEITVTPDPDGGSNLYGAWNTSNWEFTVPTIEGWGVDEDDNCVKTTTLTDKKFKVTNYTIKELADDPMFGPGEYTFRIGSTSDPYDCGCRILEKEVAIVTVDLDVDSDRSGDVDGTRTEDDDEMNTPAVMMVNNDDDNSDDDSDASENDVDGVGDVNDLGKVEIRKFGVASLPSGWKALLSISDADAEKIRIFDQRTTSGDAVIGPDGSGLPDEYEIPDITTGDLTYGIEAVDHPQQVDEQVTVSLIVKEADNSEFARDEVKLVATPFILLPNTRPSSKIYVSDRDNAFVTGLRNAVGSGKVVVASGAAYGFDVWLQDEVEIGYARAVATDASVVWDLPRDRGLDDWPEDELRGPGFGHFVEGSGSQSANYGGNLEVSPPVTVGSTEYKHGRIIGGTNMHSSLTDFLEAQNVQTPMIRLDVDWLAVGHVDEIMSFVPSGSGFKLLMADTEGAKDLLESFVKEDDGTATSGGNNTLTDGTKSWTTDEWSNGFIEVTSGTGNGQVRQVTSNTATQITVTRNWATNPDNTSEYELVTEKSYRSLFVEGDEDIGVATSATNNTLTDNTKAWTNDEWQDGGIKIIGGTGTGQTRAITSNTATTITVSSNWDTPPDATSRYLLGDGSKLWEANTPALDAVKVILDDTNFWTFNTACQVSIDASFSTLKTALGVTDSDIIKIPTLFIDGTYGADAYVPGMVNMLVDGTTVVVPEPFGPKDGGTDVFKNDVKTKLEGIGLTVKFLDDWDTYHVNLGEIHCGTNAKRTPPTNVKWWE